MSLTLSPIPYRPLQHSSYTRYPSSQNFTKQRTQLSPARPLRFSGLLDTAFIKASRQNNASKMNLLLSVGAHINATDAHGKSALHWAIIHKNNRILKALLKHKRLDINAKDLEGLTALHRAVLSRDTEILKTLLQDKRINMSVHDHKECTPLLLAKSLGFLEMEQTLRAYLKPQQTSDDILKAQGRAVEADSTPIQELFTESPELASIPHTIRNALSPAEADSNPIHEMLVEPPELASRPVFEME